MKPMRPPRILWEGPNPLREGQAEGRSKPLVSSLKIDQKGQRGAPQRNWRQSLQGLPHQEKALRKLHREQGLKLAARRLVKVKLAFRGDPRAAVLYPLVHLMW